MTRLNLFVGGRLKASVEDTPEGRVEIDKLAMVAREDTNSAVEVRRGGAKVAVEVGERERVTAETADGVQRPVPSASSGALDAAVASHPAGKPSNICADCRPRVHHTPSGRPVFHHADDCPVAPGMKIDIAGYAQHREWSRV